MVRSSTEWIGYSSIALFAIIIHIVILKTEYNKIKLKHCRFPFHFNSQNLWASSITIFGLLCCIILIAEQIPFICHFNGKIAAGFLSSQIVCMGYYQLSRLYHCFAKTKVYHNSGYPTLLFIIMYTFGFIAFLCTNIIIWITNATSYGSIFTPCGFSREFQPDPISSITIGASFYLWDFTILALYFAKIISLKNSIENAEDETYRRIMFILKRIIILTALYELVIIGSTTLQVIFNRVEMSDFMFIIFWIMPYCMESVVFSICVILMQDHNTDYYVKFLKCVQFICCCCKDVIDSELEYGSKEASGITTNATTGDGVDEDGDVTGVTLSGGVGKTDESGITIFADDDTGTVIPVVSVRL